MSLDFPNRKAWLAVRSTPQRRPGRPMRTEQFAEGTIHYSSFRAAYLEKPPTRSRLRPLADPQNPALPLLDEKGEVVMGRFPIPEPWIRVTEKPKRPGAARRLWLEQQRANA